MTMPFLRLMLLMLSAMLASCSLVAEISYRIPIKLRVDDYQPFVVTEHKGTNTSLQIHGFILSSGHLTSAVKTKLNGKCLHVDLWAVGAMHVERSRLGDLAVEFTVPDSVEEVRVGRDSVLVWDRKDGSRFPLSRLKEHRTKSKTYPRMTISKEDHLKWCHYLDKVVMVTPERISIPGKIRY